MATEYLFSNNATTTLAQSVSATATVLNVAEGTGNLFPSPSSGQAFAVTLVDAATGLTNEICYCTSRSGDQLTVIRGREGTNAIAWSAGDTCANYITADVMESWLQESDLNGYATQAWSDGRYIQKVSGPNDYTPIQGGVNKTTGNMWFSYTDASGNVKYAFSQPAGDYATNPALQSVNTNLQNQINNRVLKTGDTSTGTQYSSGWFWGGYNAGFGGGTETGALRWTNFGVSFGNPLASNNAAFSGNLCVSDIIGNVNDNSSGINMRGYDYQGKLYNWFFAWNGRVTTPGGVLAFESDISNLQNQINGKQPAGSYVTTDVYSSDFSTSDSRVINLPYGHRLQGFIVAVSGSGVHNIYFPVAFSSPPETIVISHGLTNGNNASVSVLGGWTATSFQIQTNGDTSVNFLAMGAK